MKKQLFIFLFLFVTSLSWCQTNSLWREFDIAIRSDVLTIDEEYKIQQFFFEDYIPRMKDKYNGDFKKKEYFYINNSTKLYLFTSTDESVYYDGLLVHYFYQEDDPKIFIQIFDYEHYLANKLLIRHSMVILEEPKKLTLKFVESGEKLEFSFGLEHSNGSPYKHSFLIKLIDKDGNYDWIGGDTFDKVLYDGA